MQDKSGKRRIFDIIQIGNVSDLPSRIFDIFIVFNIILNITFLLLQTFDYFAPYEMILDAIDALTIAVFIVEYALRIWTSNYLFPGHSYRYSIFHFIFSLEGMIDLLTILPFFFLSGFVAFRMLRVVRIFHLFRINASYDSFHVIRSVLYEKRNQLASSLFIILILMLSASLFMYSAEHDAQPEVFKNAFSGIWWSMSTLLTVGYGDIYPITTTGKILAIIIAFLGVGSVAIPTGIISAGFVEQYTRIQNSDGSPDLVLGLQSVIISMDSAWIGCRADQILKDYSAMIVFVRRGGASFVPDENYAVQLNDVLAVHFMQDAA